MNFADWLQQELNKKGWSQVDLVRSAKARGYKVTTAQISRILNREQEGGISAVIAIAHALGVPREKVFRVRGWLLSEPTRIILSDTDANTAQIAQELNQLPVEARLAASKAVLGVIDAFREVVQNKESQTTV